MATLYTKSEIEVTALSCKNINKPLIDLLVWTHLTIFLILRSHRYLQPFLLEIVIRTVCYSIARALCKKNCLYWASVDLFRYSRLWPYPQLLSSHCLIKHGRIVRSCRLCRVMIACWEVYKLGLPKSYLILYYGVLYYIIICIYIL